MKKYNSEIPLISLHIPKCGGQTISKVFKGWFKDKYRKHYFQENERLPRKHKLSNGLCIHGHFNNEKGFGILDYYPKDVQYITFIRNPIEMMTSNYFFWKYKARERQLKNGTIIKGSKHDYKDIDDFFLKRPKSHFFNFLPDTIDKALYRKVVNDNFVFVGITEYMQESINILAEILRVSKVTVAVINKSKRDETLSESIKDKFTKDNEFDFEFYNYFRAIFEDLKNRI